MEALETWFSSVCLQGSLYDVTEGVAEHDNLHFDFANLSNPYVGLYECMDGAEGNLDSQGGAADNFLPGVSAGMRTNMRKFAATHDMNYMGIFWEE